MSIQQWLCVYFFYIIPCRSLWLPEPSVFQFSMCRAAPLSLSYSASSTILSAHQRQTHCLCSYVGIRSFTPPLPAHETLQKVAVHLTGGTAAASRLPSHHSRSGAVLSSLFSLQLVPFSAWQCSQKKTFYLRICTQAGSTQSVFPMFIGFSGEIVTELSMRFKKMYTLIF